MKKSKKLILAKETLRDLEKLAQGGTGYPSYPYCGVSDPIYGCTGGGGGDASAGFYMDPQSCNSGRG